MIITLTGENTFALRQALGAIEAKFSAAFGVHSVEKVDGETFEPGGLAGLLQGASLFAADRLVILRQASLNKPLWEALADWIDKVPADTTLVVVEPNPDKRTRTYKLLKTKSDFKEFNNMSPNDLAKWAQDQAVDLGGELTPVDARYLIERTAGDQWRLSQEIAKLVSYQPKITRESIDNLVEPSTEGTVFELLDAALAGNSERLQHLIGQLKTSEDPYKLFGLLASQVHILALASVAQGRAADQIAKDSGAHPFVVRKSLAVAHGLGKPKVGRMVVDVARCDIQLKSTGADPWQLIAVCLQQIAHI